MTAQETAFNECPETINMPFILFDGKAFKFTNILVSDKHNGDEYWLVEHKNGKYSFLKMLIDHDCDGTFYSSYFYSDDLNSDDVIIENMLPNIASLMNHLYLSEKL